MTGLQSLSHNLQLSQILREQIQSKLVVRPKEEPAQTGGAEKPGGTTQPISQQPLRKL